MYADSVYFFGRDRRVFAGQLPKRMPRYSINCRRTSRGSKFSAPRDTAIDRKNNRFLSARTIACQVSDRLVTSHSKAKSRYHHSSLLS